MLSLSAKIALALLIATATFFVLLAVYSFFKRKNATSYERTQSVLAALNAKSVRPSIYQRIEFWAASRGYTGTANPILLGFSVLFVISSTILASIGLNPIFALVVSIPLDVGIIFVISSAIASKRKLKFDKQFLDGLTVITGQLNSGVSIRSALQYLQGISVQPLKSELAAALLEAEVTRDIVEPLRKISNRYPSRAFDLFIAAIEIDTSMGGKLEPALTEASDIMSRDFELIQEAQAEVSQARGEFYGILILLGVITASIVGSADATTKALYFSVAGLIILGVTGLWVAVGILRTLNILRQASGAKPIKLRGRKVPNLEKSRYA